MVGHKTKGTQEWADSEVNNFYGCSNDCLYCYAKYMALRFKRIESAEAWKIMNPNYRELSKGYTNRDGRIMYPSSHDITNDTVKLDALEILYLYLDNKISKKGFDKILELWEEKYEYKVYELCLFKLKELLEAGNEVLITTKPDPDIIVKLTKELEEFKDQIQFRFTITSISDKALSHWEPGAPCFGDRLTALNFAFNNGYKTSLSIEPYLDENPIPLILTTEEYVTESIWLGIMNPTFLHYIPKKLIPEGFEQRYSPDHIKEILSNICDLDLTIIEKIRLKDSISNMGLELTKYQTPSQEKTLTDFTEVA